MFQERRLSDQLVFWSSLLAHNFQALEKTVQCILLHARQGHSQYSHA